LVVKYADHLPAALKSISFEIKPREKGGTLWFLGPFNFSWWFAYSFFTMFCW
jgi:hypothetical protein